MPAGIRYCGLNVKEFIWGATSDWRPYWTTNGRFDQRRLDCSEGLDFTGMSPQGKDLQVSHVLHKAFVDVNEEGTEAAAATAVVIKERAAPMEAAFRADRPFLFVIRDNKSGVALFMGRYKGPVG